MWLKSSFWHKNELAKWQWSCLSYCVIELTRRICGGCTNDTVISLIFGDIITHTKQQIIYIFIHNLIYIRYIFLLIWTLQTYTWTVLLAFICSWWRRSHCWLYWYCRNEGQTICYLFVDPKKDCGCEGVISVVTFSMLLWCFCSLSRSVGRATLMNLWIGASRRLSVSFLPSSAMCPADCPRPTPLCNLDTAPAQFYLTAPTDTVNTRRVWL